jgi:phosphohistidine swiveling domain-containing protein
MNPLVISLDAVGAGDRRLCGNKAAALSTLLRRGVRVPRGFCVTTEAYRRFVDRNGLHGLITMELGRKRLEDMRWEEMWDASLRIRNGFLRAAVPGEIRDEITAASTRLLDGKAAVVRSSSLLEDAAGGSFAGLHESFVNVRGAGAILHHVKLVWASLWSDAVLAYARELEIEQRGGAMAVIVQELIAGERSGVAFGVNPNNERESVIEAVFGLNKGLVDGDVQPDRYLLDRKTGEVRSIVRVEHDRYVVPSEHGVAFTVAGRGGPALDVRGVRRIFGALKRVEEIFGAPQDMEWTISGRTLYVLQSRPITAGRVDTDERRVFDLGLRKSFDTLKVMAGRITKELVPEMIAESDRLRAADVSSLNDAALTDEIKRRREAHAKWKEIYWNEFIPFAHGIRLFGQVYNDRVQPDDPFEFVDLLSSADTLGVKRNRELQSLAERLRLLPDFEKASVDDLDPPLAKRIGRFIGEFTGLTCGTVKCGDDREAVLDLLKEMARGPERRAARGGRRERLLEVYLSRFDSGEREYARELYEIAQTSYRLRDDDNIYLGRFESALEEVMEESRRRLGERCADEHACTNPEEVMRALRFPDYRPRGGAGSAGRKRRANVRARQLRGQPAGPGVARGPARIVETTFDLLSMRSGDILVCDAIDPSMTFVIPLAAGIVERRGGMLVHGAIIAREYGLPCVTGVPDATRFIQTGDALTVDGYFGLVIIHKGGGDA